MLSAVSLFDIEFAPQNPLNSLHISIWENSQTLELKDHALNSQEEKSGTLDASTKTKLFYFNNFCDWSVFLDGFYSVLATVFRFVCLAYGDYFSIWSFESEPKLPGSILVDFEFWHSRHRTTHVLRCITPTIKIYCQSAI